MRDGQEQKAWNRKALGELHQPIDMRFFEVSCAGCSIPGSDYKENRKNDIDQALQHMTPVRRACSDIMRGAGSGLLRLMDHHPVEGGGDVIGGFGVDGRIVEVDMHVGQYRALRLQLFDPPERLFQMRMRRMR